MFSIISYYLLFSQGKGNEMSTKVANIENLKALGFHCKEETIKGKLKEIVIGLTWTKGDVIYHSFPNSNEALLEIQEVMLC